MQPQLTGVFREEVPSNFLTLMTSLARSYLGLIETKVLAKYSNRSEHFREVYLQCLRDINAWSPKLKSDECAKVRSQFPYLPDLYEKTYMSMLREVLQHMLDKKALAEYKLPTFDAFYIMFLSKLPEDLDVQQGRVTSMSAEQVTFLFMNIIRSLFMECIAFLSLKDVPFTVTNLQMHTTTPVVPPEELLSTTGSSSKDGTSSSSSKTSASSSSDSGGSSSRSSKSSDSGGSSSRSSKSSDSGGGGGSSSDSSDASSRHKTSSSGRKSSSGSRHKAASTAHKSSLSLSKESKKSAKSKSPTREEEKRVLPPSGLPLPPPVPPAAAVQEIVISGPKPG